VWQCAAAICIALQQAFFLSVAATRMRIVGRCSGSYHSSHPQSKPFAIKGAKRFMSPSRVPSAGIILVLAALAPVLAGCDESNSAAAEAEPAAPEVSVVTVTPQARAVVSELPGRISPTRIAEVRPRVSGIVIERAFHQGSEVKAGDPLYRIDPKPFEIEVQSSEAALAKAEATSLQAEQQARRISYLAKQHAASEAENDRAIAAEGQARADVEGAKAALARAKLNLDYTTVRAPIDGVVGAALVSEGALVIQDQTNLATVQQLASVYADFTQSVTQLSQLRRAFEAGDLERIAPGAAKVRLALDDDRLYPADGELLFSDARVDIHTGQVTLRGQFPNPARDLLPGMYVRVRIEQGIDGDAIAVPQQAIQRNGGGGSGVFVVKHDNRVALQPVRTGSVQDGQWFVTDGLKAGDRVVVEGFQKFTAGDRVKPQTWTEAAEANTSDQRAVR
jgi:membrane fusion protein, multidrug efflux system